MIYKLMCIGLVGVAASAPVGSVFGANALRYPSAATPILDNIGGKIVGTVAPGAPLELLGQSGSAAHVALHGWLKAGANVVVYLAPDKHVIVLSSFKGSGTSSVSQTTGGIVYHAVTIDGFVPANLLVEDVQTVWKHAADVFSQNCASCHALPKPTSMPADQWPAILKTQASNAGLDDADTALVSAYLETNAGH